MDPYLEDPALWTGVHQNLITYANEKLVALLPSHYATNTGERLYVVQADRPIYPDVAVFELESKRPHASIGHAEASTALASDPPWVLSLEPVEIREVYLEILAMREGERVVTAIEVLSYTNKTRGSDGRELYQRKQRELLASGIHLLEIDLLRNTEHIAAPPREELERKGRWDFLVSLHRGRAGKRFEVWTRTLRERLPRVRVPLAGTDPDVILDLQEVFDRCYDACGYVRRIDYRREPASPLSPADAAWADALLREKGCR
jgi:hypothetical protein